MSNSRVSNKQILDAILGLTEAIKAQHVAPAPAQVQAEVQATPVTGDTTEITVGKGGDLDPAYLANRKVAAQEHANNKGTDVVLFARRNQRGETKLAFALAERFATLKDKGLIGPIATYQPE